MKDIERVMIGLGKAAEIMGCGQAQLLMTRMCTVIGEEVGKELIERGTLSEESTTEDVINELSQFFGNKPIEVTNNNGGIEIKFSNSSICPNLHMEKECPPICPFLGLIRGIGRPLSQTLKASGNLDPKGVCSLNITVE